MTPITTPAAERCPYPELEERVRARLDAQEVLARQARERREEAREYAERAPVVGMAAGPAGYWLAGHTGAVYPIAGAGADGTVQGHVGDIVGVAAMGEPSAPAAPQPTLTSISPASGPAAGGNTITVTGSGFTSTAVVELAPASGANISQRTAASTTYVSPTELQAVVPAGSGTDVVSVQTAGGTTMATLYTYTAPPAPAGPPTVSSISPSSAAIGATVTITGTNLGDATAVDFGTSQAVFSVTSTTSITATVPAPAEGLVPVKVVSAAGASGLVPFVYAT